MIEDQNAIIMYPPTDFAGLGGNVIVTSEADPPDTAMGTVLVRFNAATQTYDTSLFDGTFNGFINEGASFVDCDVPTPTPTPTASPSPTATFTPTATATATAIATATPTPTFTPTPTPAEGTFSWTGATNTIWNTSTNWSPSAGAPPGAVQTALFNGVFSNQPNVTLSRAVGTLHMATGSVAQNVTLSSSAAADPHNHGLGILGTGILIDNTNAFTLTITARVGLDASQTWTNNSGNLFTVSGTTLGLGEDNTLVVNGTGNTLISAVTDGAGMGSAIVKGGSGTLTITRNNAYSGGTTVNGGTLLVNNTTGSGTGDGDVTVNGAGTTLGGTGIISKRVTVNIGANLAPGNGGHTTSILTVGKVTLSPGTNFLVDINGTTLVPGMTD